jgi:hypothetical protein
MDEIIASIKAEHNFHDHDLGQKLFQLFWNENEVALFLYLLLSQTEKILLKTSSRSSSPTYRPLDYQNR